MKTKANDHLFVRQEEFAERRNKLKSSLRASTIVHFLIESENYILLVFLTILSKSRKKATLFSVA